MKKHTLRYWWTNTYGITTCITERFSDDKDMALTLHEVLEDTAVVCVETETDGIITVHKPWATN